MDLVRSRWRRHCLRALASIAAIVVGQGVVGIYINGLVKILYRCLGIISLQVRPTPAVVRVTIGRVEFYGFRKIRYGSIVILFHQIRVSPVVICERVRRIQSIALA